ncbi:MAG: hypothetical protein J6T92_03160, partial [Ottowia sp.]|nr:hypothetical protein [Ottowia sp.]
MSASPTPPSAPQPFARLLKEEAGQAGEVPQVAAQADTLPSGTPVPSAEASKPAEAADKPADAPEPAEAPKAAEASE